MTTSTTQGECNSAASLQEDFLSAFLSFNKTLRLGLMTICCMQKMSKNVTIITSLSRNMLLRVTHWITIQVWFIVYEVSRRERSISSEGAIFNRKNMSGLTVSERPCTVGKLREYVYDGSCLLTSFCRLCWKCCTPTCTFWTRLRQKWWKVYREVNL